MNLSFVKATSEDIPVIFQQAKCLIEVYEDPKSIDIEKVFHWVSRKITQNISGYTAVLQNGVKCGYYRLCEDGELDDLYVLPGFRNQGIGTEIMERCLQTSKENIYLYVFSRNTGAIAFYERFGFTIRQTVGQTRLIMHRNG